MPSMVQNNMLSTKIRIKLKWIESNWIPEYDRRPLGLKNVRPQCLFSKDDGVDEGQWKLKAEIVRERGGGGGRWVIKYIYLF